MYVSSSFLIASRTWKTLAGDVTLFALGCWAFQEQNKSGGENAHSLWAGILNLTQIWRLQTWVWKRKFFLFQTYNAITSSDFFFVANFHHFQKGIFCYTFLVVLEIFFYQQTKKNSKIATIAYNMIGCFSFILLPINVFWKFSALQFHRSGNCILPVKNVFYTETHVYRFFLAQNREDLPPKKSLVPMYEMHFPICVSKP